MRPRLLHNPRLMPPPLLLLLLPQQALCSTDIPGAATAETRGPVGGVGCGRGGPAREFRRGLGRGVFEVAGAAAAGGV